MDSSLGDVRATVGKIVVFRLAPGSTGRLSVDTIKSELAILGVLESDDVRNGIFDRGLCGLIHEVVESFVDKQGRHVFVSVKKALHETGPHGEQISLFEQAYQRADALGLPEQRRSPRAILRANVLGLLRKAASTVLSPERAQRAVTFIEALFAEQDREDAGRVA